MKGLSTQGLEVEYDEIIEDGEYDDDQITLCFDCGKQAENPGDRLCIFCKNSENIMKIHMLEVQLNCNCLRISLGLYRNWPWSHLVPFWDL